MFYIVQRQRTDIDRYCDTIQTKKRTMQYLATLFTTFKPQNLEVVFDYMFSELTEKH